MCSVKYSKGEHVSIIALISSLLSSASMTGYVWAQESTTAAGSAVEQTTEGDLKNKLTDQVGEIGNTLNESAAVQEFSAGILEPIYSLAEFMSFPSFYWVAFTLMVAGVVSFAFQLVFTKFFLLFKMNLNVKEILGDVLGLLISVVGLVLTTQAATQNSDFAENSVAVLSATIVGAMIGLVFYWWGQKQEFQAARKLPKVESER
ncbi:MAG: hypothetical protein AB8B55_24130 [Mariniblastus sp.]